MKLAMRAVLAIGLAAAAGSSLSCNVNDYCLNCSHADDGGGSGDGGGSDGGDDGGGSGDGGGPCVPTGPEQCDGKDNDCNGFVDDGVVIGVGDPCDNQMGACAGGVKQCVGGMLKCSKSPTPELCDNIDNDCNGLVDEGDPGGGGKCGTDTGECIAGTNHCVSGTIQCQGFVDHTHDAEQCNLLDDDCDGSFDEDLTNMGPCGIKTCVGGTNRGTICQTSGDCTGGGTCQSNVGACTQGTLSCAGGVQQCMPLKVPHFEQCDTIDNDCDGLVDEDFDLNSDINNCGMCGHQCAAPTNALATCAVPMGGGPAVCGYTCKAGYHDLDGLSGNGCEYGPCFATGVEVCDGLDNDCDGLTDGADPDLGAAPAICSTVGECATGGSVTCDGVSGWVCHYAGNVSTDGMGNIIPETLCDDKDNDCNGIIDDHQLPQKNQPCDDGHLGECRSFGTYQCDTGVGGNPNGPAVCKYSHVGVTAAPEACDNKDNDCDGVVDNTLTPGVYPATNPGLEWVKLGDGHQMMKYEAAKPDADGSTQGNVITNQCGAPVTISGITESGTVATVTTSAAHNLAIGKVVVISGENVAGYNATFSVQTVPTTTTFTITATAGLGTATGGTASPVCPTCSSQGVVPWTNVTYAQAQAACAAVGAGLCTDQQWHRACSVVAGPTYPISLASSGNVDQTVEAENYQAIAPSPITAETAGQCGASTTDDDFDGWVNDGCPQVGGAAETGAQCANNTDDDGDGAVNDGCPAKGTEHSWVEDYTVGFSGISALAVNPDSGTAIITNANITTDSPRLDYTFNFQKATSSYHIWALLYSPISNSNRIAVTLDGAAADNNSRVTTGSNGSWQWVERTGGTVTITAGVHTLHVWMIRDGVRIDAVAIRDGTTSAPPLPTSTHGNTWAYATTPNTYQPTTCNGHDYDATQDATLTTGSLASCYADDSGLPGNTTKDRPVDMSGNVKEWTQAHQTGQNPIRGGASNSDDIGTSCALNFTLANDTFFFPNVGFRCCK